MLPHTGASFVAASARRLHPLQVLALALGLAAASFVLHSQVQVHSQLAAAQQELADIKGLVAPHQQAHGAWRAHHHTRSSSSGSSPDGSSSRSIGSRHAWAVHQLIDIVRTQQRLLRDMLGPDHATLQQSTEELISTILAEEGGGAGDAPGQPSSTQQQQQEQQLPSGPTELAGLQGDDGGDSNPFWSTQQLLQPDGPARGGLNASSVPPGTLCLDMTRLLGLSKFMSGITWEPKECYTGLAHIFSNNATAATMLQNRLLADLTAAAAAARGVQPSAINITAKWWEGVNGRPPLPEKSILSDPAFLRWQVALVRLLGRYMVRADNRHAAMPCPGAPWSEVPLTPDDLPLPACKALSDAALIARVGRHGAPFDALTTIASVAVGHGMCLVPAHEGHASFGDFLMARVMNSKWRTFDTNSLEEDAVVFLWDLLYQAREVFFRQRWLGVAAMQSPFDFMAIADIIHEAAPDVIVETGTANGGSALMWASMLELNGLTNSTVITVDLAPPGDAHSFGADAAPVQVTTPAGQVVTLAPRRRQTAAADHHLWKRYVTFVQGSSVDPAIIARIKGLVQGKARALARAQARAQAAAAGERTVLMSSSDTVDSDSDPHGAALAESMSGSAGSGADAAAAIASAAEKTPARPDEADAADRPLRVLVLLDAHHGAAHVLAEMEAYCSLVSPGSYCVVEDTKLTRWGSANDGPLVAVKSFVGWHPEFRVDRSRELLFTHHPFGYLQRVA